MPVGTGNRAWSRVSSRVPSAGLSPCLQCLGPWKEAGSHLGFPGRGSLYSCRTLGPGQGAGSCLGCTGMVLPVPAGAGDPGGWRGRVWDAQGRALAMPAGAWDLRKGRGSVWGDQGRALTCLQGLRYQAREVASQVSKEGSRRACRGWDPGGGLGRVLDAQCGPLLCMQWLGTWEGVGLHLGWPGRDSRHSCKGWGTRQRRGSIRGTQGGLSLCLQLPHFACSSWQPGQGAGSRLEYPGLCTPCACGALAVPAVARDLGRERAECGVTRAGLSPCLQGLEIRVGG